MAPVISLVKVRGQHSDVGSLLPLGGIQGSDSDCQSCGCVGPVAELSSRPPNDFSI